MKLLAGQAQPLYQVYPPGMPGHQADKKWYGHDSAKAKQLLAEAGYPDGFTTTLYTRTTVSKDVGGLYLHTVYDFDPQNYGASRVSGIEGRRRRGTGRRLSGQEPAAPAV